MLKKTKQYILQAGIGLLFCIIPIATQAQMFSADNTPQDRSIPDLAVYVGIEPLNFEYEGANIVGQESNIYAFDSSILRFMIEGRGLDFYLGTGGDVTGLENQSYFDAGIKAGLGIPLFFRRNVFIQVPIQLHSTYTRVTNEEVVAVNAPEFQHGTFEIAAGAQIDAKIADQLRIGANFIPSYGFAFSTRQRDAGGSIFGMEGEGRLFFDHLFGSAGLSLGYNYDFRDYDIDGEILDYRATGHRFLIGLTF